MKRVLAVLLGLTALPLVSLHAQLKIIAKLDTTFATAMGGKVETSLGDYNDEATCDYVYFDSKITVCGKVGTAVPYLFHFGAVQVNPNGTFDSTFGTSGKTVLSWGGSDYPNAMYMQSDNKILAAGVSGVPDLLVDQKPTVFRINPNGTPDSTFGQDGHVSMRYDANSYGEFTNIFPEGTGYIACGSISTTSGSASTGFYAVRFLSNGSLDSSYGVNGKALLPLVVRSAKGFLSTDAGKVMFAGVSDSNNKCTVVLGRLSASGQPDSSFGTNGYVNTGIELSSGSTITSAVQQDYKMLIALPIEEADHSRPFTLVRITTSGIIDSTYGSHGFTTIPIAPFATVRGMNIANNGKTVVNGSAGTDRQSCASARVDQKGVPDPTFNLTGYAVMDVDNGQYSNYLIRFDGIGQKRYMGFGGSIQNGKEKFLIARFKDDTLSSNAVSESSPNGVSSAVYPNPASTAITIESADSSIYVLDALGREYPIPKPEVMNEATCQLDVSHLPNGTYYLRAGNQKPKKFIVAH